MPVDERSKIIFLVEDNRGDIRLIQEALKATSVECQIVIARDGMEAMAYLRQDGDYDPTLKHIPVVVLTTSRNEEDIFKSYDLHVNCYISKSRNLSQLFKIVRGIEEFWLETATLPPSDGR